VRCGIVRQPSKGQSGFLHVFPSCQTHERDCDQEQMKVSGSDRRRKEVQAEPNIHRPSLFKCPCSSNTTRIIHRSLPPPPCRALPFPPVGALPAPPLPPGPPLPSPLIIGMTSDLLSTREVMLISSRRSMERAEPVCSSQEERQSTYLSQARFIWRSGRAVVVTVGGAAEFALCGADRQPLHLEFKGEY
jgi:hypothetical protein